MLGSRREVDGAERTDKIKKSLGRISKLFLVHIKEHYE